MSDSIIHFAVIKDSGTRAACGAFLGPGVVFREDGHSRVTCPDCKAVLAGEKPAFEAPKTGDNWPEMGDGPVHLDTKEFLIADWMLNGVRFAICGGKRDVVTEAVNAYESFMRACDLRQKVVREQHEWRQKIAETRYHDGDGPGAATARDTADERLEKTQS